MPPKPVEHQPRTWRQSQLSTYLDCPERYRRQHIAHEPSMHSAASLVGSAAHEVIERIIDLYRRGETTLLDASDLTAWASEAWAAQVYMDKLTGDPAIPWSSQDVLDAREQDVYAIGERFHRGQYKLWAAYGEPTQTEVYFSNVRVPELPDVRLEGTMDCVTDQHVILDWKTSRRPWDARRAAHSVQRLVYSAAYEQMTGTYPRFVFVIFLRGKADGSIRMQILEVPQTREDRKLLALLLGRADDGVSAGSFPLNPGSALCQPDFCPAYQDCMGRWCHVA